MAEAEGTSVRQQAANSKTRTQTRIAISNRMALVIVEDANAAACTTESGLAPDRGRRRREHRFVARLDDTGRGRKWARPRPAGRSVAWLDRLPAADIARGRLPPSRRSRHVRSAAPATRRPRR